MIDDEYQAIDRVQRWRESGGWKVTLAWLVGYNPQRLLTDQRSELAKFASGAIFGETYMPDDEINLMRRREPTFPLYPYQEQAMKAIMTDPPWGGVRSGRFSGRLIRPSQMPKTIPAVLPAGEYVVPARKLAEAYSGIGYSAQIAIQAQDNFTASMKRVQEQMARWQEKVMLRMLLATEIPNQPGTMFRREARIAKLLFSNDRRQRKRGERLFEHWHKTRSGINWTRDEKRELLRRGYGRARPFDYIEPENYRKD